MYKIPSELYQKHKSQFDVYLSLLLKWNEKINLTSFTHEKEIIELHFIDALAFNFFFEDERFQNVSRETFLDIGSGNGVPGLVLKIIHPQIKITLAESIQKKCSFIKTVIRELNLKDVFVLNQNIGDASVGSFDFVISRATCSLNDFVKIGSPQLKSGGILATLKGEKAEAEIVEANPHLSTANLSSFTTMTYKLSFKENRKIVWCSKL